jgi:SecA DEAD-like domain
MTMTSFMLSSISMVRPTIVFSSKRLVTFLLVLLVSWHGSKQYSSIRYSSDAFSVHHTHGSNLIRHPREQSTSSFINTAHTMTRVNRFVSFVSLENQQRPFLPLLSYPSQEVVLKMGVMEDFLTGQDQNVREEENKKYLLSLQVQIDRINELESTIEELTDDELKAKTMEFQQRIQRNNENPNGILLEEAFAVVREAAW